MILRIESSATTAILTSSVYLAATSWNSISSNVGVSVVFSAPGMSINGCTYVYGQTYTNGTLGVTSVYDYNGNPGGSGGFAIVGNVATNSGVIKGGTGGLGGGSDWGGLGCGGSGGTAVNGSVGTNFGEVCGGRPGAYDPENIGGYGETGSGNGGDAVNGDVYANYGVIVGGTLFESTLPPDEAWDVRGSGGNGVTGNVVTNAGIICGATDGGGSGTAVKGTVGGNSGFIHNGTVFSPPDIYKVYNGSEQSVTIMPPAPYSLVECESGVDVGEYSLTLKLCGPQYLWGDINKIHYLACPYPTSGNTCSRVQK